MEKTKKIFKPDFLIIPGPVAFSKKLQPADKNVYGVIYWLFSLKDGKCTASNKYIADVCGMRAASVSNSLLNLDNEGFIKRLFKDENKKNRSQIIPLTSFSSSIHQMMEQVTSNDVSLDTSNDVQIRNITKRKNNNVASPIGSATSSANNSKNADKTPMSLSQFIVWCAKSDSDHVKIIGEWAETVKPEFETKEQWQEYLKRNFRPAKALTPFSRKQLIAGFEKISEAKKEGWLTLVTLETLYKFITNQKI